MRYAIAALSSFILTFLVTWNAYSRKQQFYPTVIYLTSHQPCIAVLLFQCVVLLLLLAKCATRIFFGRLQQVEIDNLVSQSWYTFFDMCLVFAFFQDELGIEFILYFSILLFVRAFHWLVEERIDYMERTPVINALFHLRINSLLFILFCVDCYYIKTAYWKPIVGGKSVHVALGIEYFNLLMNLISISIRYVMHTIDSMREHSWDKKTMYLLYVDIIVGFFRLFLYVEFTWIMWNIHPFPFFVCRPIYLSVRALKKAIHDVLMSRRAIGYMNTVFRDATSDDLAGSSDTVCIICREEMRVNSDGAPQDSQHTTLKRLPCSHIFHVTCLRSWFQRQQTCPTCRMDVIRQARLQHYQANQQQQQQAPGGGVQPAGTLAATFTASTTTTVTTNTTAASSVNPPPAGFVQPQWGPAPGQFLSPFTWNGNLPPSTSASSQNLPMFPPVPPPIFASPFFGMPIVYPGNLFPNPTSPMPEPPSGSPDLIDEARLRASAEARFTALRQINVLLNAAVLQMNAYLNTCSNPSMAPTTESENKDLIDSNARTSSEPTESNDASAVSTSGDKSEENELAEVRRRRLERLAGAITADST